MNNNRSALKTVLPLIIIIAGAILAAILLSQKKPPQKREQPTRGIPVQLLTVDKKEVTIPIRATGTVMTVSETDVTTEVKARVTKISPTFTAGRFVDKGEFLFSLEKTDFELALEKAKAEKEKIKLELITLENQAAIARDQWHQIHPDKQPQPLTVFKPQLDNIRAQLSAAEASIRQAELNIERTTIYAPFSGLIQNKKIALGQYVLPGNSVGHIIDSSLAEISVPLPLEDLAWLQIPAENNVALGSQAEITLNLGEKIARWQGRLARSLGTVDVQTRMATVIVQVNDPYGLHTPQPFPLLNGAFVDIEFSGITLPDIIEIPRSALRGTDMVWTAGPDNRLSVRQVTVNHKLYDRVLISKGLEAGDHVVISAVAGAAEGMKLRTVAVEGQK